MEGWLAKDIMSTPPISVKSDTSLSEIIRVLDRHDIRGVPVTDYDGRVIGVVSEKDLRKYTHLIIGQPIRDLCAMYNTLEEQEGEARGGTTRSMDMLEAVATATAGVVMTDLVITAKENTPLLEVIHMINQNKINRIPIVDDDGRLTGVVSRKDVVRAIEQWFNN